MGVNQGGPEPKVERVSEERGPGTRFGGRNRARETRRESAPQNEKMPTNLVIMRLRGRLTFSELAEKVSLLGLLTYGSGGESFPKEGEKRAFWGPVLERKERGFG